MRCDEELRCEIFREEVQDIDGAQTHEARLLLEEAFHDLWLNRGDRRGLRRIARIGDVGDEVAPLAEGVAA